MNATIPIETERKFLIKKPSMQQIHECNPKMYGIFQAYLKRYDPKVERRVRRKTSEEKEVYYYTEKKKLSDCSRSEVEKEITVEEYMLLLREKVATITKDRYVFTYQGQCFELDIYPDWEHEAILEIELESEGQKVTLPEWIEVIKEVTDDPKYKNANLAKQVVSE